MISKQGVCDLLWSSFVDHLRENGNLNYLNDTEMGGVEFGKMLDSFIAPNDVELECDWVLLVNNVLNIAQLLPRHLRDDVEREILAFIGQTWESYLYRDIWFPDVSDPFDEYIDELFGIVRSSIRSVHVKVRLTPQGPALVHVEREIFPQLLS